MVAGCLLTVILIVMPVKPDVSDRWLFSHQSLHGECNTLFPEGGKMYVQDRQLIIVYLNEKYVIPFPPKVGRWIMKYFIGSARADLGVWGMVQVRMGPKLPI